MVKVPLAEERANFAAFVKRSKVAKLAYRASLIQAATQVALEAAVAGVFLQSLATVPVETDSSPQAIKTYRRLAEALSVYHIIYILAAAWQPLLTFDSIAQQNAVQLITIQVLNVGLFGYAIMQFMQETSVFRDIRARLVQDGFPDIAAAVQPSNTAPMVLQAMTMAVSAVFMFTSAYSAWKLRREYDWAIYRRVGADRGTRKRLTVYFVLMMLLKLDVFFYFTFAMQFLVVLWKTTGDLGDIFIHVGVSLVMIPILYVLCSKGVKLEHRYMTLAFMAGTLGALGYLTQKLTQVAVQERFISVRRSLSFAIAGCMLMAIITFVTTWQALRNFGNGLNAHLVKRSETITAAAQEAAAATAASKASGGAPAAAERPSSALGGNGAGAGA